MKYLIYKILLLFLLPVFLNAQQLTSIGHSNEHALPLILQKLKQEKQVSFLYEPETIANIIIHTPFNYQEDIKVILKKILPPVYLKFRKVGRQNYIIKKAKIKKRRQYSRINLKPEARIQSKKMNNKTPSRKLIGRIIDEHQKPLIGATIFLPKTVSGTATDKNGHFELLLPPGKQKIEISFTGYETNVINIIKQKEINLQLKPAENFLSEVIVNAIGFHEQKDKIGASSATVAAEAIQNSGEVTLLNALGSKAANVQIARTNGDPGAATNIRIRGANTITGASNPLVILDGIPMNNSTVYGGGNNITGGRTGGVAQQNRLNDLNPADVVNVQILKGASAAALWGSRAANGVIVISTKKGQSEQLKINYQTTFSFDKVSERLSLQNKWGQGRNGVYNSNVAESWGDYIPARNGSADILKRDGQYFEAKGGEKYYPILQKNANTTFLEDNWNQVIQQGGYQQHNLSFSGGNKWALFYFNIGNLNQKGIVKKANYHRTNIKLNSQFFITDWLSNTSNASYIHSSSNRIQQNSSTASLLIGLLRTPPDFNNKDYQGTYYDEQGNIFSNRHRSYRRTLGEKPNPIYNNPQWTVFEQTAASTVNRKILSTNFKIQPSPWLQFTLQGGIDEALDKRVYFFPPGSAGFRNPGVYGEDIIKQTEWNIDLIGKAKFQWTQQIKGATTFGLNLNDRKRTINFRELTGFSVNANQNGSPIQGPVSHTDIDQNINHIRSNRAFAILNTSFYNQFFLTASGGLEAASSISGTFFYPAIDAVWQFTKIFTPPKWLNFGKLRTTYGKVGIQPAPHRFRVLAEDQFEYSTYSDPLKVNLFGGGYRIDDDQGNPNLQPEIKTEWEVGLDFRLLENNLDFSVTYYKNKIEQVLFYLELAPSSGYDSQYANAGKMQNQGLEATFSYQFFKNRQWELTAFGNFSKNKNKVLELKGTETIDLTGSSLSSRAVVGYPLGVLFGTGSLKDNKGDFILNEYGFPQITPSPIILGNPNPDWRGNLGFQISWKKLNLNILLEHSQGGHYSPRTQWVLNRFGTTAETANRMTLEQDLMNYAGHLIPKGTTVRGNLKNFGGGPVLLDETWYRTGIGGGFGDNQAYNFSIKDATFTRLRELSVSYTFDSLSFQQKTKLSAIEISFAGRNLWLKDNIPGIDPETNQTGISNGFGLDYFTNPSTRSFLISLRATY